MAKFKKEVKVVLTVTMAPSMIQHLNVIAESEHCSRSSIIQKAVMELLERTPVPYIDPSAEAHTEVNRAPRHKPVPATAPVDTALATLERLVKNNATIEEIELAQSRLRMEMDNDQP